MYTVYSMKISYLHVGPRFFCDPKIGFKSGSAGLDVVFKIVWCTASPNLLFSKSHHWRQKVAKVQIQNPWKATPDPSIPFRSQHPNPYYALLYSNFLGCCDAFHFRIWGRTNSPAKPLPTNAVFAFDTAVSAAFSALVAWQKRSMPFSQYLSGFESCLYRKESSTMQETYWVYSVIQTHNTLFPFEC